MRLFPPYQKWVVSIKNPEKFKKFLYDYIEFWNTNHNAPLKGKLNDDGFLVEIKDSPYNRQPPKIKGIITTGRDGKKELVLNIQSGKTLLYITSFFSLIVVVSAIINWNWLVLIAIPIIAVGFGLMSFILHVGALDKTKKELEVIIKKAST